MTLKLYLDDTGIHKGSRAVGVGGLIGNEAQWAAFDTAWKSLLAEPLPGKPALTKWSSYDCRWGNGEFGRRHYNEAERDRITFLFREVITKSGLFFRANMIDGIAWNEFTANVGSDRVATAESTALFKLINELQGWASIQPDGPDIAVFYDLGRMKNPEIETLSALLNDPDTALNHISSIAFLPVVKATPLQGADMIATESFWFAKDVFENGENAQQRPHFRAFIRDNGSRGGVQVLDRAAMQRRNMRQITGSASWEWTVRQI